MVRRAIISRMAAHQVRSQAHQSPPDLKVQQIETSPRAFNALLDGQAATNVTGLSITMAAVSSNSSTKA